jgi:coenzyme F420-reducing hydrogenase beta subunit
MFTAKHVGEDTRHYRADESVGYIVTEEGHAVSGEVEIETARGPEIVTGYVQFPKLYNFQQAFLTTPTVAVLSQVAMEGQDGSCALSATRFWWIP